MLEVVQLLLLLVRLFSAMNIIPNSNFEIWNNVYNSTNNSYNSKIIAIIVSKYAKDSAFGHFHGFTLGSRASCNKLDHCTLCCSVHCKLGASQILNNHQKIMHIIVKIMQIIEQQKQKYFTCPVPACLLCASRCTCCPPGQ